MTAHTLLLGMDAYGPEAADAGPTLQAFGYTRVHPVRGSPNQDGAAVLHHPSGSVILAVVDGMGGLPNGDQAAAATLESLGIALDANPASASQAILDGIDAGNRAVQALSGGAGATLAVVELKDGIARTYHVGDAAVLVVGNRGALKHLTTSHSPVGYAVEAGLIGADDALHHADRHLISNAVGTADMRIEVGPPVKLAKRDTVLVASDGVFDNLTEQEIVDIIRKGPLHKAARSLSHQVEQRMAATLNPTEASAGLPSKADDSTFLIARTAPSK